VCLKTCVCVCVNVPVRSPIPDSDALMMNAIQTDARLERFTSLHSPRSAHAQRRHTHTQRERERERERENSTLSLERVFRICVEDTLSLSA